jgi:hypothetical protein
MESVEEKRQYIIDNYKNLIPDIEQYIYERKNPNFDYSFLSNNLKEKNIQRRYADLANIIVDIRNNTAATNYYSNSINKTDNKYSNETKKLVKHLLSKGWSNNEIAYEIEKIYGSGSITWHKTLEKEQTVSSIFAMNLLKVSCAYLTYKLGKSMIKKFKLK